MTTVHEPGSEERAKPRKRRTPEEIIADAQAQIERAQKRIEERDLAEMSEKVPWLEPLMNAMKWMNVAADQSKDHEVGTKIVCEVQVALTGAIHSSKEIAS